MGPITSSRREFLKGAASAAATSLAPMSAAVQAVGLRGSLAAVLRGTPFLAGAVATLMAKDASAEGASVPFRIYNANTSEKLEVDLFTGGDWNQKNVMACHWLFRDWRESQAVYMDPRLYAALYVLQRYFAPAGFVQLNSGYRTEKTNDMLRRKGYGAAPESFHLKGRASDISIADTPVENLAAVAQRFRLGGLGLYPHSKSRFLHIDSGPVGRIWYG